MKFNNTDDKYTYEEIEKAIVDILDYYNNKEGINISKKELKKFISDEDLYDYFEDRLSEDLYEYFDGINIYHVERERKRMKPRKNYDKVTSLLYKALYTEDGIQYKDLKEILEYIMEEYK